MVPQIADGMVAALSDLFGADPQKTIEAIEVDEELKKDLQAAHVEGWS